MNNKFFKLFKKEILTILRDRKSFLTFLILSVALTPLLIAGVGFIQEMQAKELSNQKTVLVVQNPEVDSNFVEFLKQNNQNITLKEDISDASKALENKDITGFIELTDQDQQIFVKYVYDQSSNVSTASVLKVNGLVQAYSAISRQKVLQENNLSEKDLNPVVFNQLTLQELQNKPAQNDLVLFLLPYIILIGLIQGAAQFAIELTAGEKERNTLATTLSLNTSRTTIGLAKIAAILVLSLISLILNITSLIITFTLLSRSGVQGMSSVPTQAMPSFSINITPTMIGEIFLVLLPLSFFISSLLVLLGTFARNQKEGGLYILPLMMATVFIGLSGQAFDVNTQAYIFFIPILGQVVLLKQILLGYFIPINYLISTVSTFLLFFIALFICINMFKREEVIFRQ